MIRSTERHVMKNLPFFPKALVVSCQVYATLTLLTYPRVLITWCSESLGQVIQHAECLNFKCCLLHFSAVRCSVLLLCDLRQGIKNSVPPVQLPLCRIIEARNEKISQLYQVRGIPYLLTYLHIYLLIYLLTYIHIYTHTYIIHTYINTYLLTYILTYLLNYLLTYLLNYLLT